MIFENTKLLLGLLYRPVSAMGRIVDDGHWLYAAIVVAALSMIFHAAITSHIYNSYQAVYRELPATPPTSLATHPPVPREDEEFEQAPPTPHFTYDRLPLPLVGTHGWWFVSFEAPSFATVVMGIAVLYVPFLILLVTMAGANASSE